MMQTLKATYADFISFLKNPIDQAGEAITGQQKFKLLLSFLCIEIPFIILFTLLLNGLEALKLVDNTDHSVINMMKSMPIAMFFFITVIVAPILEELLFRLYLRYPQNYLFTIIVGLASFSSTHNGDKTATALHSFWIKRYKYIFYFSALIFGFVHLFNFPFSLTILLLSPILVAPQIILGSIIGYLRVRYGFMMGFFMHALHNAVFVGLGLLAMHNSTIKVKNTTKIYTVTIEKTSDKYANSISRNYPDSLAYENTSLKATIAYLLNTNERLLNTNDREKLNSRLNFHFKNKTKDSTKTKRMALEQLMKSYDFTISKKILPTTVWDLKIVNPALLANHKSNGELRANEVITTKEKLILKNCGVKELRFALGQDGKHLIIDQTDDTAIYNFTLSLGNFETTQEQLRSKYGITLTKRKMNSEHSQILFKKSK
jgi:membrane protease YdiL (CAAX protease family)